MLIADKFAGQNWLITPAAAAANQTAPKIQQQRWLMILSGVAFVQDLKGNHNSNWRQETVEIFPDYLSPLNHVIAKFAIPTPPDSFATRFQVEQWAPFVAASSMAGPAGSGFAVDSWRPSPFVTIDDAFSNVNANNIFVGIRADCAVLRTGARVFRLSYHFSLLGRIVFEKHGPFL